MFRFDKINRLIALTAATVGALMTLSAESSALPRTWMSLQWGPDMDAKAADLVAHGVEVVEVPPWNVNVCRDALRVCRQYGLKSFTYTIDYSKSSKYAIAGKPYEQALMIGGVYRGRAIDRNLFSFAPSVHEVIIEPPVYSARQPYGSGAARNGHYFSGRVPVRAEVVVPLKPFDGQQHLQIIPCALLAVEPGTKPENDTVTDAMRGTLEIENRRLVRIRFDLSPYAEALLDKVGIAVYWASDPESAQWKMGAAQMSVFSESTRAASAASVTGRLQRFINANGGTFPSDVVVAVRFGDECFNVTGWMDSPAASYPLYDYSDAALAAFCRIAPGLEPPRTWGFPEIYGADAYGAFLYNYHKGCAELTRATVEAAHRIAPGIKVFRNTTRSSCWSYQNDMDGSGQELLARELDFLHLDPYPVSAKYNASAIPFDMGYLTGLARRFKKPIVPWLQAHAYAPCGLGHVTPDDLARMWLQHKSFAPDGIMWLGYGHSGGGCDFTFPKGNAASWEKAREIHQDIRSAPITEKPQARLAVIRPYSLRATSVADRRLRDFVHAWSVDEGLAYDIFEVPPFEADEVRAAREAELARYPLRISAADFVSSAAIKEKIAELKGKLK